MNNIGDVAFKTSLSGSGVDDDNDQAIYRSVDGILELVAREGDLIEIYPGEFRTIETLYFDILSGMQSGNEDGERSAFNNNGDLVYIAKFTDGSQGVLSTVPEPATMVLLSIGGLGLLTRRKCRV